MNGTEKPCGFGSSVKRFKTLGLHPELISVNASNPLGPGQYDPKYPHCAYKNNSGNWKTKLESEEFSKYLGFRHPQLLCQRLFDRSLGGPGTYEIFDHKEKIGASTFENVSFGQEKRFHSAIKDETLPPGVHNLKCITTKFTKTPPFEWDGLAPRLKSTEPPYRKAPNRYTIPTPSIVDKVVSKRGPYDTFTGPRDETTIKGHFAPPLFKPPDTFYKVPSALDQLLHHPRKKRCGKFLHAERFPQGLTMTATKNGFSMYVKNEGSPGPAVYTFSDGIQKAKETLYPFNSSKIHARPPPNWRIHPGPDRYEVKYPTCHKRSIKGSWMFLSTAERELVKAQSYSNFIY